MLEEAVDSFSLLALPGVSSSRVLSRTGVMGADCDGGRVVSVGHTLLKEVRRTNGGRGAIEATRRPDSTSWLLDGLGMVFVLSP